MASDREILDELWFLLEHGRPAWHRQAACRGQGPGRWFPLQGEDPEEGRAVCGGCPVAVDCAEAGRDERAGLWGGTTPRQRMAQRRTAA